MVKTLTKRGKELGEELESLYMEKIEELQGSSVDNIEIRNQLYSMYTTNKKFNNAAGAKALKKVIFNTFSEIQEDKPITKTKSGSDYSYQPYSGTSAEDFMINTTWKKEFRDNKNDEIKDRCSVPVFRLTPHQYLLSNFMSPDTKYMSLLLFHGTGTGKTCTAISIAENFKDTVDEYGRIIVICGKSLKDNFYTNLFDIDKIGEEDQDSQCIGSVYYDLLNDDEKTKTKHLQHNAIRRKINKFYDISTYFTFAKDLSDEKYNRDKISQNKNEYSLPKEIHDKKKQMASNEYRAMIQKKYSNRVIIVDEVQSLRDEDNSEFDFKLITDILMDIALYSRNTRMILLSATPMYNEPGEIEWLINVMRVNDDKSPIEHNKVFTENGDLTEEGGDILAKYSRGYISYVTNDDPINFPLRLYPDVYNDPLSRYNVLSTNHRDFFNGKDLISNNNFNKLKLFCPNPWTVKDGIQKDLIREYHESKMGKKTKTLDLSEANKLTQMSLIVYPNSTIGSIPRELMTSRGNTYKYANTSKPFLEMGQLQKYSIKFYETIKKIAEFIGDKEYGVTSPTDGIIFVYCSEVESGITPFCLALEQYGFSRYGEETNQLDKSDLKWSPISWDGSRERKKGQIIDKAKYIVITGDTPVAIRDRQISAAKNINNLKGRNIRVIIGSRVMAEGISLKWVRQIHILDAWYHLNRIEQIIGRGLRFCSHKEYPRDERNVMVYLHSIAPMKNKTLMLDSHDMYLYRKAWGKSVQMGRVETILKENSIDCELHKKTNNIDISKLSKENKKHIPKRIKFTQRKKGIAYKNKRYTKSKKYSKNCSYTDTCDYTCHKRSKYKKGSKKPMTLNKDTYSIIHEEKKITQCINLIKTYYRTHVSTDFETLLKYCSQTGNPEDYKQILEFALHIMVTDKIYITHNGKTGYIKRSNNYITFTQYNRNDDPLYYRKSDLKRRTYRKPIRLLYTKVHEQDIILDKGSIIDKINVNGLVDLLKHFNMKPQEEDKFVLEYNLDRLTYDEMKNLLPKVYLSQNENDRDKQIYNYFKDSFYNDGKTDYVILFNNSMKPEIFKIDTDLLKVRDELDLRLLKNVRDIYTDEQVLESLKKGKKGDKGDKEKKEQVIRNKKTNLENLKKQIKKNNNKMIVNNSSLEFLKTLRAFKSNTDAKRINPIGKGYGFIKYRSDNDARRFPMHQSSGKLVGGEFATAMVSTKIGKGNVCISKSPDIVIRDMNRLIETEKIPKKIIGDTLHKLIKNSDMETIKKEIPKFKQLLCLLQEYLLRHLTIEGKKYWYSRHDYGMYLLELN